MGTVKVLMPLSRLCYFDSSFDERLLLLATSSGRIVFDRDRDRISCSNSRSSLNEVSVIWLDTVAMKTNLEIDLIAFHFPLRGPKRSILVIRLLIISPYFRTSCEVLLDRRFVDVNTSNIH